MASESSLHVVRIVALRALNVVVEQARSFLCLSFHGWDTSLLKHVGDIKTAHIDGQARGRVVEGVGCLRESFPVAQHRGILAMSCNQIISHDYNCRAGRTDVFLSASIHDTIFAPIDLLGAEV